MSYELPLVPQLEYRAILVEYNLSLITELADQSRCGERSPPEDGICGFVVEHVGRRRNFVLHPDSDALVIVGQLAFLEQG